MDHRSAVCPWRRTGLDAEWPRANVLVPERCLSQFDQHAGRRDGFANAPVGLGGPGSNTIADPTGLPLANACAFGGGVFADTLTTRRPAQVTPGAPAGTIAALHDLHPATVPGAQDEPRVGIIWDWSADNLLISDPAGDGSVVLHIPDVDGQPVFQVSTTHRLPVPDGVLNTPVDMAPVAPETHHAEYSSNTSLSAGSDVYMVNHGNNTIGM